MNLALFLSIASIGVLILLIYLADNDYFRPKLANWLIPSWMVIGLFGSIFIHSSYTINIRYYDEEHEYYIHSLGNDKYLEGNFGLFTGTIGETDYYFFYVNYVSGMQREKLKVSQSYIREGNYEKPYVSRTTMRYHDEGRFWKVFDETDPIKYTLYVPKNTIVRDFKVR